jgi:hypothetical protein
MITPCSDALSLGIAFEWKEGVKSLWHTQGRRALEGSAPTGVLLEGISDDGGRVD